jgi:hypothetical protein
MCHFTSIELFETISTLSRPKESKVPVGKLGSSCFETRKNRGFRSPGKRSHKVFSKNQFSFSIIDENGV